MGFAIGVGDENLDELVARAQSAAADDSPEMREIIRRFDGLAKKIARSFSSCPHTQEDLANVGRVGLVRAVRAHRVGTPGFPSYARQFIRGAVRRAWLRMRVLHSKEFTTDPCDMPDVYREADEFERVVRAGSPWDTDSVGSAVAALSADHQRLLVQRYEHEMLLREMAAGEGTSVPAVSQRLATAHRALARRLPSARKLR